MDADFITRNELQEIINARGEACVSIYMPMVRAGADVQGNTTRLKNALTETEEKLQAWGWRQSKIDDLLAEPRKLLAESPFWREQLDGLAIFLSPEFYRLYRLPVEFEPLTLVAERFHIKPLLPLFTDDGRFYVLALSQKQVRLFQGTRLAVDEVELEDTPRSMAEALWDDPERELQHHTTTSGLKGPGAGGPEVVHHGHGTPDSEELHQLRRYSQRVSAGVQKQLRDEEAPIVLAAVDYLHPIFKEAFDSPHLLDEGITGNPDRESAKELHEKAWAIIEPLFQEAKEEVIERYKQLAHREQASDELEEIVPAAVQGRVDALVVSIADHRWGIYDAESHAIEIHDEPQPSDEDLLDFAAVQTLANGGTVYALEPAEMPAESPIAAVYRF